MATDSLDAVITGTGVQTSESLYPALMNAGFNVVGVADSDFARAVSFAEERGVPHVFRSQHDMLVAVDAPFVVIAAPLSAHAPLTEEALLAGRHVRVEKPIAESVPIAKNLRDLAASRQLVLAGGYQYPFQVQNALRKIREGLVGVPTLISGSFRFTNAIPRDRPHFWNSAGAGVVPDFLGHPGSVFLSALAAHQHPVLVTARGSGEVGRRLVGADFAAEDTAWIAIQCTGGLMAEIKVSWVAEENDARIHVIGPEGTIKIPLLGAETDALPHAARLVRIPDGEPVERTLTDCVPTPTEECFMLQMEAIRDAILTGSELPFGAELAVRTQILIDAAQRSIREDGAAVPVGDSFGAL